MCSDPSGVTIDITHGNFCFHNISSLVLSNIEVVRASEWKHKQPHLWLADILWMKLNKIGTYHKIQQQFWLQRSVHILSIMITSGSKPLIYLYLNGINLVRNFDIGLDSAIILI